MWELASAWGRVGDTENTLLYRSFPQRLCRKFRFLFQHPGRLSSQPRLIGNSLSTRRIFFQPQSPLPLKEMPSKFIMVSIPATCGIRTTSWNCKSAARINVFPLLRKKNDSAHIWHLCIGLSFEWIKRKGFDVILDGVCDVFMPQSVNCNCGFSVHCGIWAEI